MIYDTGPFDQLRSAEPEIVERWEDLEDAIRSGNEGTIVNARADLATAIDEALWREVRNDVPRKRRR